MLQQSGSLDEMLDSEEHLSDQLESLPYLCRFRYDESSRLITSLMDPLVAQYEEVRGRRGKERGEERGGERLWMGVCSCVCWRVVVVSACMCLRGGRGVCLCV